MNHRAEYDHTEHTPRIAVTGEHEERRNGGAHQRAEERDDRDRACEYSKRQPVRNAQRRKSDCGQRRENHHAKQLTRDPCAQIARDLEQHITHQFAL